MSEYRERLDKAIKEAFKKLNSMSDEKFREKIDSYMDDSETKDLYYAWNPWMVNNDN